MPKPTPKEFPKQVYVTRAKDDPNYLIAHTSIEEASLEDNAVEVGVYVFQTSGRVIITSKFTPEV